MCASRRPKWLLPEEYSDFGGIKIYATDVLRSVKDGKPRANEVRGDAR
jgi:hypothetical protein